MQIENQYNRDKLNTLSKCDKQIRILTETLDSVRKSCDKTIKSLNNKLIVAEKTNKSLTDEAIYKQKVIENNFYDVAKNIRNIGLLLESIENRCNQAGF